MHIIRCVERMGDRCAIIAKLVRLSGYEAPKDKEILDAIERMGQLASSQANEAFAARNVGLTQNLVGMDGETDRMNREIFNRAVDVGDDLESASGRC